MTVLTAIGLMSGTSADGVDAAIVRTDGVGVAEFGAFLTLPTPEGLRRGLLGLSAERAELDGLEDLEAGVTALHAEAVRALLAQAGVAASAVDVVGFHGQTVLHRPERRFTRQLGDGQGLADALGIAVVNRFRHADVAAGGQGAPLVPLFHQALARGLGGPLAVLNLGGVGNVTFLDGDLVLAFDTGPGNALIDDWVQAHAGIGFDEGGRIAAGGRVDEAALSGLMASSYFARVPPKSLDRNAFSLAPVQGLAMVDGAATLAAFSVAAVAAAREHMPRTPVRWLVCGGGRLNPVLMAGLRGALGVPVEAVEAVGWDGDALEAQAFGFLAVRSLRGLALSLPGTTGVPVPMAGGVLHRPR